MNQIKQIQKQLKEENKDAWIIVDYEGIRSSKRYSQERC